MEPDLGKLSFISSIPTDKIVFAKQGYVDPSTLPVFGSLVPMLVLDHNLGRPVFTKMAWSYDGISWNDENLYYITDDGFNNSSAISFSTAQTVNLLFIVGAPLYYRVIGFWIDDYDATNPDVPPLEDGVGKLYFDSRRNYRKIIDQQEYLSTAGNVTSIFELSHDQPLPPIVKGYFEMNPGQIWPANWGGVSNPWLFIPTATEFQVYSTATKIIGEHYGYTGAGQRKAWMIGYYDG